MQSQPQEVFGRYLEFLEWYYADPANADAFAADPLAELRNRFEIPEHIQNVQVHHDTEDTIHFVIPKREGPALFWIFVC